MPNPFTLAITMPQFTACLIQLNSSEDIHSNVQIIEHYLESASAQKADMVFLPENAFYLNGVRNQPVPDMAQAIARCQAKAKEYGFWLVIGSAHIPVPDNKYYNRSLCIAPDGSIIAEYDKIHLFDVELKNGEQYRESDRIQAGNKAVIVPTPFGKMGMTICYDVRFAALYRSLAKAGADFITVPAAFTYTTGKAHWHTLLRARAIETGCYIIAAAQCGLHPGNRQTYGHSLIVSPWGEIIAEAGEKETGILTAEIDIEKVQEARSMIPALQHDREFGWI